MPVSLKIEVGPGANTSLPIELGKPLRIGRTQQADHAVPDQFLSKVHFEIRYDGHSPQIRDLNSSNGTLLNGISITESALKDGDQITAGQTRFSVHIEPDRINPVSPLENPVSATAIHDRLLTVMRGNPQPLYAVLDTAHEPDVFKVLLESKSEYAWLFEGEASCKMAHFAPYFVPLAPESPLLERLVRSGWGKSWAIYLTSSAAPWELLSFLRRLLVTRLPDASQALLRFFDPRVLRILLASSSLLQQRQLFGLVHLYIMEDERPNVALGFSLSAGRLIKTELPLSGDPPTSAVVGHQVETPLIPGRASASHNENELMLREDQLMLFGKIKHNSFQQSVVEELRKWFPAEFAAMGEARMKDLVEYGCTRAQRYGIRAQPDIRRYVELMVQLGRDFDTDPQLPWASQLLARRLPPAEKLNRLVKAAAES